ncbi:hypothetical protein VPHG_00157 [Vibrio phage 11895-B1]|uniref:hypothetical protein n=1 Tax=Vibrio phage 11895-B1 TaxID=754075 RepID=UPI0002C09094|nr:hypothetical protein VPHG_00157 [Vibrio phage 11895-B1]AGH32221.1 hypothetical protein VPHG_00157 [Vibrio phage 11895-B1]
MNKLSSGLESEKKWIDNNTHMYKNIEHAELVKHNIELRYRCKGMLDKLNQVLNKENK